MGRAAATALAEAAGVPGVAEVWIRYGDDGTEERLTGGRASYRALAGAEDGDVVLVVGSAIPLSRTLHDSAGGGSGTGARGGGEARPLPDGEQRFKRLGHLVIKEPIPMLLQKVGMRICAFVSPLVIHPFPELLIGRCCAPLALPRPDLCEAMGPQISTLPMGSHHHGDPEELTSI